MNGGRVDGFTDVETPHVLKAPPIIAPYKYPRHIVCAARATVYARKPWVGSAPQTGALLQCIYGRRGTARKRAGGGRSGASVRGDLATASRGVAEGDGELTLGVGRPRVVVVLVGE